ncbi:MAG: cob(I)yrinic acid a,c-diamide adenosyltransferase [Endomicrobium sp.]|jgi:cob(I)alamin adenosyltransferase|nr:cob(I)yrinic acid a,c-diamide adenosyltransferase [Endomicrobium sp.]
MIIINTGNGKGKTSAAIGQIVRSLGHGFKVCLIQLFKHKFFYGEQNILLKLNNLDFFSFAEFHPNFYFNMSVRRIKAQCALAINKLKYIVRYDINKYHLVVLEEFNIALRDNFIDKHDLLRLVKKLSKKSNIIITGRNASKELIDFADIVTDMKEIKHYYNDGKIAHKGIEY